MPSIRIDLRVQPKARRNDVVVLTEGRLGVWVTAAPESGKANRAVIELVANKVGVPKRRIRIVKGHATKVKVLEIDGLDRRELFSKLEAIKN